MDKTRIIKLNSSTRSADNQVIVDNMVLTYNRSDNLITLESFNFADFSKTIIIQTQRASELFPEAWEKESGFDLIDYIKEKTQRFVGEKVELKET